MSTTLVSLPLIIWLAVRQKLPHSGRPAAHALRGTCFAFPGGETFLPPCRRGTLAVQWSAYWASVRSTRPSSVPSGLVMWYESSSLTSTMKTIFAVRVHLFGCVVGRAGLVPGGLA